MINFSNLLDRLHRLGPAAHMAILVISVVLLLAALLPIANHLGGTTAMIAAGAAAAVCFGGSAVALLVGLIFRDTRLALGATLAGMFLRMGLPLVVSYLVIRSAGPLAEGGMVYYILAFYLLTLFVDTVLLLPNAKLPPAGRMTGGRANG